MAKSKKGPGEKAIGVILKNYKIKYKNDKKIKLAKDSKKYRKPSFYLPEHNLAIEYFSTWNVPQNKKFEDKERKRFMEQVGAYQLNGIHCVYIYPSELVQAEKIILNAINTADAQPKNSEALLWVIPWLDEDKIEEPWPEDFLEKPNNWKMPWFGENKIEEPKAEDFSIKEMEDEEDKMKKDFGPGETKTTITERKYLTTETKTEVKKEHKVLVGDLNETVDPFGTKKESKSYSGLGMLVLALAAITLLVFFGYLATFLSTDLFEMNDPVFYGFVLLAGLLVLLSAFYSIKKNIFVGFISVAAILVLIALASIVLLGDNMVKIVITVIIVVAIIPIVYYMVNYNEK